MIIKKVVLIAAVLVFAWACANLVPILVLGLRTSKCETSLETSLVMDYMMRGTRGRLDSAMSAVVTTARGATLLVEPLRECWLESATPNIFDPFPLVALLRTETDSLLQGAGVITAPFYGGDFNSSNKISFEVTSGSIVTPACPNYLYGFTSDDLQYESYCIALNGTVDYSNSPYSGPDYGLVPGELSLLEGTAQALFLPVFNLVGRQSITYEVAWRCDPNDPRAYGIGFGQTNLLLYSQYLESLGFEGIILIVERSNGLVVATNIPGQTVNITTNAWGSQDQVRLAASNSTNPGIHEVSVFLLHYDGHDNNKRHFVNNWESVQDGDSQSENYDIRVESYEYEPSGATLDWIVVVATERKGLIETSKKTFSRADVIVPIISGFLAIVILLKPAMDWLEGRFGARERSPSTQQLAHL